VGIAAKFVVAIVACVLGALADVYVRKIKLRRILKAIKGTTSEFDSGLFITTLDGSKQVNDHHLSMEALNEGETSPSSPRGLRTSLLGSIV